VPRKLWVEKDVFAKVCSAGQVVELMPVITLDQLAERFQPVKAVECMLILVVEVEQSSLHVGEG
jgi:hypothetical protein